MAEQHVIGPATPEEVAHFARRRTRNEHDYQLYTDLAHVAPNGVFVARDEGAPIGIAIPHAMEDEWFLSELFVEPSFRSRGIGLELLIAAAGEANDLARSGIVDPAQLDALAFYARRGVPLHTLLVEIAGAIPHASELERMAAGEYRFGADPIDPMAHAAALSQLDREVRGTARPQDHLYFSDNAKGFVFTLGVELAGYAYVWPSGRIGPMASTSPAYLVQMLAYALAALRASYSAEWCTLLVPGVNTRILRTTMRARLRIVNNVSFATDGTSLDLARYVGLNYLLF
ncbi:MAG TPA: GNAT family N-acetyltransferase [Candidatus Rubrimentiphilum sp.]|nr:GNAT family N-acetyltransferase [Candidatus Rubrimentiphilum sp.]